MAAYFDPHVESPLYRQVYGVVADSTTPTLMFGLNSNRVCVVVTNTNIECVGIWTFTPPVLLKPQFLVPPGSSLFLRWEDVGSLVTLPMYVGSSVPQSIDWNSPGGFTTWIEIIYTPLKG